jgi:hypothetical protein
MNRIAMTAGQPVTDGSPHHEADRIRRDPLCSRMAKAGHASSITYSTDFLIGDFFIGEVAGVFSASMATAELAELPRFDGSGTSQSVEIFFTSTYALSVQGSASDELPSGTFIPFPPFIVNGHKTRFSAPRLTERFGQPFSIPASVRKPWTSPN